MTLTALEIRNEIRYAQAHGRNVYLWPLESKGYGIRITRARTYCGETQVYALGSGEWITLSEGDTVTLA